MDMKINAMKKILLMLPLLVICFASCKKEITDNDGNYIIPFKDPNFLEALLVEEEFYFGGYPAKQKVDADGDGQITVNEAKSVKYLSVSRGDIKEMSEIRYFTALT